jgi:hypothetical protein
MLESDDTDVNLLAFWIIGDQSFNGDVTQLAPTIEKHIRRSIESNDFTLAVQYGQCIAKCNGAMVPELTEIAVDPTRSSALRAFAVDVLGVAETEESLTTLSKIAHDRNVDPAVLRSTIARIERMTYTYPAAEQALLKLMQSESRLHKIYGCFCVRSVAHDDRPAAYSVACNLLVDSDAEVRRFAAAAIREMQLDHCSPEACAKLIELLDSSDEEMSVIAANALKSFEGGEASPALTTLDRIAKEASGRRKEAALAAASRIREWDAYWEESRRDRKITSENDNSHSK